MSARRTKIGCSKYPGHRLNEIGAHFRDLKMVAVFGTDNPRWLEKTFHIVFHHRRVVGEWFSLTKAELASVGTLPKYISEAEQFPNDMRAHFVRNTVTRAMTEGDRVKVTVHPAVAALAMMVESLHGFQDAPLSSFLVPLLLAECERLAAGDDTTTDLIRKMTEGFWNPPPRGKGRAR